jgi:hypothetical protein
MLREEGRSKHSEANMNPSHVIVKKRSLDLFSPVKPLSQAAKLK